MVMSGSDAPMPLPEDFPAGDGWVHVGWRCTSSDHVCLHHLGYVDDEWPGYVDEETGQQFVHLLDSNHLAGWTPVFANLSER